MKLTRKNLKEIVKEEVASLRQEKMGGTMAKSAALQQRKDVVASGVNDAERQTMTDLMQNVSAAAKAGNITSGRVSKLIDLLNQALEKLAGAPAPEAAPEAPLPPGSRY